MSASHEHPECFCPLRMWPGPRPGEATRDLLLQLLRPLGGCCPSHPGFQSLLRTVWQMPRTLIGKVGQRIRSELEKGDKKPPLWPQGPCWHQVIFGALSYPSVLCSFSTPFSYWESQCGLVNINSGNTQVSLENSVTPELMLTFPLDEPTEFPAEEAGKPSPPLYLLPTARST